MGVCSRRLAMREAILHYPTDHVLEVASKQTNKFYSKYIAAVEWQCKHPILSTICFNMRFDEVFTKYTGSATEWMRIFLLLSTPWWVFSAIRPWSSLPALGTFRTTTDEALSSRAPHSSHNFVYSKYAAAAVWRCGRAALHGDPAQFVPAC